MSKEAKAIVGMIVTVLLVAIMVFFITDTPKTKPVTKSYPCDCGDICKKAAVRCILDECPSNKR